MKGVNFKAESNIRSILGLTPTLGDRVMIDPTAIVMGDVFLGDDVSIWPLAAVRGDVQTITVGCRTNIQDSAVLHVTHDGPYNPGGNALLIGKDVTVGHRALLHGCVIADRVLVGMGAIVMDSATVEEDIIIAAGSLVSPNKQLLKGNLYAGSPAKKIRQLTCSELNFLRYSANGYVSLKQRYLDSSPLA